MQQAALVAVGQNLIVDVEENLRGHDFDLKAHLVVNAVRAGQAAGMFAAQFVVKQATAFGEFLLGSGRHFGQMHVGILPRNDVSGARDTHRQSIVLPFDGAHGEYVKQLGVQGTPIELKEEIAYRWSEKINTHDWSPSLFRESTRSRL
jgi:hypothetical protein